VNDQTVLNLKYLKIELNSFIHSLIHHSFNYSYRLACGIPYIHLVLLGNIIQIFLRPQLRYKYAISKTRLVDLLIRLFVFVFNFVSLSSG